MKRKPKYVCVILGVKTACCLNAAVVFCVNKTKVRKCNIMIQFHWLPSDKRIWINGHRSFLLKQEKRVSSIFCQNSKPYSKPILPKLSKNFRQFAAVCILITVFHFIFSSIFFHENSWKWLTKFCNMPGWNITSLPGNSGFYEHTFFEQRFNSEFFRLLFGMNIKLIQGSCRFFSGSQSCTAAELGWSVIA